MLRDHPDDEWRSLLTIPADDATSSDVITFSPDGRSLLAVSSIDANTSRLIRLDLTTGDTEVLTEDDEADVAGVLVHPDTREPRIVTLLKDRSEYVALDSSVEDDLKTIRALHPGDPVIQAGENADSPWLVAFTNDAGPVAFFTYDPVAHTGRFLFDARPELTRYQLAEMEPFSFTSRDGLTIHGYATFPPGADRSGLPGRDQRARRPSGP